jgi:hypothetical protein
VFILSLGKGWVLWLEENVMPVLRGYHTSNDTYHCSHHFLRTQLKITYFFYVKLISMSQVLCYAGISWTCFKCSLLLLLLLFMSMEWDNVSEMQLPTGLLFIPQVIYEYGEPWWNDTDRGKPKNSEKTCPSATLSTTYPHMDWPGHEPRPLVRGQQLTTWAMAQPCTALTPSVYTTTHSYGYT